MFNIGDKVIFDKNKNVALNNTFGEEVFTVVKLKQLTNQKVMIYLDGKEMKDLPIPHPERFISKYTDKNGNLFLDL